MKKTIKNGQKSASPLKNIVFGSAKDFTNKGINFEGNSIVVDDAVTYAKGTQVNGVWFGNDAMITMLSLGATHLLQSLEKELKDTEDADDRSTLLTLIGNCIHSIRFSYLMDDVPKKEADRYTVDLVLSLNLNLTEAEVRKFLDESAFAV